jgi:hypothetical protein
MASRALSVRWQVRPREPGQAAISFLRNPSAVQISSELTLMSSYKSHATCTQQFEYQLKDTK